MNHVHETSSNEAKWEWLKPWKRSVTGKRFEEHSGDVFGADGPRQMQDAI